MVYIYKTLLYIKKKKLQKLEVQPSSFKNVVLFTVGLGQLIIVVSLPFKIEVQIMYHFSCLNLKKICFPFKSSH